MVTNAESLNNFKKRLNQALKRASLNKDVSVGDYHKELSTILDISQSTIYGWRRGERFPNPDQLAQLLRLLARADVDKALLVQIIEACGYTTSATVNNVMADVFGDNADLADRYLPARTNFIGIDVSVNFISNLLISKEAEGIVAICGLGGIGKTALATAITHLPEIRQKFTRIIWLNTLRYSLQDETAIINQARLMPNHEALIVGLWEQINPSNRSDLSLQSKMLILRQQLKKDAILVVIDNLETLEDFTSLYETINELIYPSKFLVTTRCNLGRFENVICYPYKGLNQSASLDLIQYEARRIGNSLLEYAQKQHTLKIVDKVGGNPLAIKLVVGQLSFLPLQTVLESLDSPDDEKADKLFASIYRQTWEILDPTSREVMLFMPLMENATFEQLQGISGLTKEELNFTLSRLGTLSLVEVGGDNLNNLQYKIHQLTQVFLMREVMR